MTEREQIVAAIQDMAEVYGRKLSPSALEWWATMWEPYDYSRLKIAMQNQVASSNYMPTIHQLKRSVQHLYPTKLAQRVAVQWQKDGGRGVPTQEEIDEVLRSLGREPGEVTRKLLIQG